MKFNAQYQKGIPESILYSNDERNDFNHIITQTFSQQYTIPIFNDYFSICD